MNKILHAGSTNKVDVALLCETWLRKDTVKFVDIPHYTLISKERKGKKGGGVCILMRDDLKIRHRTDLEIDSNVLENVVAELKGDKDPIILASCYRAPNSCQTESLDCYNSLLSKLAKQSKNVVIGLDHNLDLLKSSIHKNTHDFLKSNIERRLLPCITKPTRVTHSMVSLIDNLFCSETLYHNSDKYIVIDDMSDHLPCLCLFNNVFLMSLPDKFVFKRKLSEKNIYKIKSDIANEDWITTIHGNNCNEKFGIFHNSLMSIIDKHAPEKSVPVKQHHPTEPWLTKGLIRCQKKQKVLYKNTLSVVTRKATSNDVAKYKSYKSTLQRCKRYAKEQYYHTQCIELKNNTRKIQQLINRITSKKLNKQMVIERLSVENLKIESSIEIAEEFGKYFSQIGKTFANKIK